MAIISKMLYKGLILASKSMQKQFIEDTINSSEVNKNVLLNIIDQNKNTEYGKNHKFSNIKSIKDYQNNVPLGTYEDFESYILREAQGEKNILTKEDVIYFGHSSGTTGKQKLLPITKQSRDLTLKLNGILCQKFVYDCFSYKWTYEKGVMLVDFLEGKKSKSGVNITSASSAGMSKIKKLVPYIWTSPVEVMEIEDKNSAFYLHVLFALKDKNLMYVNGLFISSILDFFRFIENNHKQLVTDIRNGKINEMINIDENTRNILNKKLGKSLKRSYELEKEFNKGFKNIAKRIWPNIVYIGTVTGANFANYNDIVRKYIGDLPICSIAYAATEGFIGINPYYSKIEYIIIPNSCFFEFIEISHIDEKNPKTLLIDQLEKNKSYEIVITNCNGLYRYRLGDILRVVGFYNNAPKVEFLYRKNQLLNMVSEKTTENQVKNALQKVIKNFNCNLIDYTTFPDNSVTPGRYIFYLEIENFTSKDGISLFEYMLDNELKKSNLAYGRFRDRNRLAKLKVKFVRRGTFAKYKRSITQNGISNNQIKIPRVIYDKKTIEKLYNSN